ncbi:MAG: helix-turn-helix domain-containing protein [Thalassobaculaceae bacterium]|uniref:helix-turn-helix domain-containing protein n=1 Tax=Roseitalea porphyridii TaxID=1852022 RepID=UPI0032EBE68B
MTENTSLTVQEVADRWRCDYQVVARMARQRKIAAFKVGRLWRIPLSAVKEHESCNSISNSTEESGQPSGSTTKESGDERVFVLPNVN